MDSNDTTPRYRSYLGLASFMGMVNKRDGDSRGVKQQSLEISGRLSLWRRNLLDDGFQNLINAKSGFSRDLNHVSFIEPENAAHLCGYALWLSMRQVDLEVIKQVRFGTCLCYQTHLVQDRDYFKTTLLGHMEDR